MRQPINGLGVDAGAASVSIDYAPDRQPDSLILVTKGSEWFQVRKKG